MNYQTYDEYKDSGVPWLGKIPVSWQVKRNIGIFDESKECNSVESELLSVTIERGIIKQNEITAKKDSSNEDKSKYKVVKPDYLAYNKMRMWQGAIGRSEFDGIVSPAYIILKPRTKKFAKYFHYLYRTELFIREANRNSYGLCDDMNSLRYEDFKTIYSPLPPEDHVERIVEFLDVKTKEIDEAIGKKEKLIELLKEQKSIIINQAVTKGLNPNAPMKDSGIEWIGQIPAHWEVKKLRFLCKISTGSRNTEDAVNDGKYPFYVRSDKIERINSYGYEGEAVLTAGDGAGVAKVFHYINGKFDYHQRVYAFTKFNGINGRYFYEVFSSLFKSQMDMHSAKSTVDSVRLPFLQNFVFQIPPEWEQLKIVENLKCLHSETHTVITKINLEITKLKEFKQTLIAHVVIGKIKV